ncbi:hypothetical protein NC651_037100 [Populus alba x Populus x berolinensis]|nr:hypothetical protein NC651_037100 [Populus alba x Populus x berolinensis]
MCETLGFQSFQQSALEKLSDVTTWYIRNIGKTAQFYANLAAMKSRFCYSEEGQKKVLLNQRPAVQFKIQVGKNSLAGAPDLSPQKIGVEKISKWFGKDSENDDNKRRAEKILKQSMENPSELGEL